MTSTYLRHHQKLGEPKQHEPSASRTTRSYVRAITCSSWPDWPPQANRKPARKDKANITKWGGGTESNHNPSCHTRVVLEGTVCANCVHSCLSLFSREEGNSSLPRGPGPARSEAEWRLKAFLNVKEGSSEARISRMLRHRHPSKDCSNVEDPRNFHQGLSPSFEKYPICSRILRSRHLWFWEARSRHLRLKTDCASTLGCVVGSMCMRLVSADFLKNIHNKIKLFSANSTRFLFYISQTTTVVILMLFYCFII